MIWLLTTLSAWSASPLAMAKPAGGETWGYIDTTGEFVIEPKFRRCEHFTESGYANIYEDKVHSFIDTEGKPLQTEVNGYLLKSVFGIGIQGFHEGMTPISVKKQWGFMNADGKVAIPPKYEWVSRFVDGYATAKLKKSFFVLDKKGTATPVTADGAIEIRRFDDGLAPFKSSSKLFGYVDTSGRVAIQPNFKAVGYFVDGLAWAKTPENTVGFIDKKGEWVIKPIYTAAKEFNSGLARVKKEETWAFVKPDGTEVAISDAEVFKDFSEGLAKGKKNSLWGFFDTSGTWVIEPQFENTRDFKNGYAAVKKGGLWGFVDKTGKWVIEPTFQTARDFEKAE